MSTTTTTYCDIKNCDIEADHKQKTVSVRYMTEITEGRSTTPYLLHETLDFCKKHYQQYVYTVPIEVYGAQGFNDYHFGVVDNE